MTKFLFKKSQKTVDTTFNNTLVMLLIHGKIIKKSQECHGGKKHTFDSTFPGGKNSISNMGLS